MNAVPPAPTFVSASHSPGEYEPSRKSQEPSGAPAVPPAPTFHWKQALVAIVLIELALIGLYVDTAAAMVEIWWRSETFNHAFLVPPISLWLIREKRHVLARVAPQPTPWLVVLLAALAFGWLLGELAAVNAVTQFAFVGMLVLAVPMIIGIPAAGRIAFPLAFLFFAVPFGEFVMPTLMDWTAHFTVAGLRASGIPVYQEGLHFVIPSGRWSVVQACSGVRYLMASIVVGTLYAYLNYQSLKRRLIFVGVAILVPLVANWLRAYMIVMLGHLSGNTIATGVDHLIYGWVFFGVVIMIMFTIGLRWREHEAEPGPLTATEAEHIRDTRPPRFMAPVVLALAIALTPRAALVAMDAGPTLPAPVLAAESLAAGGWHIAGEPLADWQPAFANPSATLSAALDKNERRVGIFIAYYRQQNYERKLISSSNALVQSGDMAWAQVAAGGRPVEFAGQSFGTRTGSLRGNAASLGAEPPRFRVWHWYWIDGRFMASDHLGKLRLALAKLMGRGDESAAVFIYAPEPEGDAVLGDYLASAGGAIATLLEQAAATANR